jgi:exodeoxyribonuclease X
MALVILDFETSGLGGQADVVEMGSIILTDKGDRYTLSERANPLVPIEAKATEIHGIRNEDVAHCRPARDVVQEWYRAVIDLNEDFVMVSHNWQFDSRFLHKHLDIEGRKNFCSLKLSRQVLPDLPSHKLEFIYKYMGFTEAVKAHSAYDDCVMLERVLSKLLPISQRSYYELSTSVTSAKSTREPKLLKTINFGKHKGTLYSDVPKEYLTWLVRDHDNIDVRYTAKTYLK